MSVTRIEVVNYNDLAVKAKEIRKTAEELNMEFTKIYTTIDQLREDWWGVRYNDLALSFNNLAPTINNMTKLTYREIPFALETVANNFSQADSRTNATSAQETAEVKMKEISDSPVETFRYMQAKVGEKRKIVVEGFKTAGEKMDQIESTYNKITWVSESAEVFREKFTQFKKDILDNINEIRAKFDKLIREADEELEETEKKNTV